VLNSTKGQDGLVIEAVEEGEQRRRWQGQGWERQGGRERGNR